MATGKEKKRVLILDDDPDLIEALAGILADEGLEVHRRATRSVADVMALKPDLVMIDCPPGAKAEVLKFVQQMRLNREIAGIPILLGLTSTKLIEPDLLRERSIEVLVRPFSIEELVSSVSHLLDVRQSKKSSAP